MASSYPYSSSVTANTDATAAQYNNLRNDALARVITATAGENLTSNQAVYIKASDSKAYKAKAGATAAEWLTCGFVNADTTSGNTATIITGGFMDGFSGLTPGSRYFLDESTYGAITATQTKANQIGAPAVGIATSATTLLIDIIQPTFTRIVRVKGADESVTSSTTPQVDDDLCVALPGSTTWLLNYFIKINSPAAAGFLFQWSLPAGATFTGFRKNYNSGGSTVAITNVNSGGSSISTTGGSSIDLLEVSVHLVVGTGGNINFQWAQNASNGTPTYVKTGSWLMCDRVA